MKSKRSHEGYLLLDHRGSPGIPESDISAVGLPPGSGQGMFEAPTYTCAHCQRVVIIEPRRTRERSWCKSCDHYICDDCGVIYAKTLACASFRKLGEAVIEAAALHLNIKEI
jgi:hypothetical protein